MNKILKIIGMLVISESLLAGEADIVDANVACQQSCRFTVTVQHADTGWDHYANRWEILSTDGKLLATRTLLHPHVDEQPFTRSLSNVQLPSGTQQVIIRAIDSKHGSGGVTLTLDIPTQ